MTQETPAMQLIREECSEEDIQRFVGELDSLSDRFD